jgi:hypothetical protein
LNREVKEGRGMRKEVRMEEWKEIVKSDLPPPLLRGDKEGL